MRSYMRRWIAAGLIGSVAVGPVMAETVKIGVLDAYSGPSAGLYTAHIRAMRVAADLLKQKKIGSDFDLEFIEMDTKGGAQESLVQLRLAIEQGIHFVMQGSGSGPAAATIDAIQKNNERSPGKEVVFLNYASADPDLTNDKCSFWHFRFDVNSDMRTEAITTQIAATPSIRKIYLLNQNWPLGKQSSKAAKDYLQRKRPAIEVVGDDLVPIGQVKDYSPYVAKIRASGADTVLTSSFGADLVLLVKAARESGLSVDFYTYYGNSWGVPTAVGASGEGRMRVAAPWLPNNEQSLGKELLEVYRQRHPADDYPVAAEPSYTAILMLLRAFEQNKSADPVKAAFALEGMKIQAFDEVEMRASDHQAQQPLYFGTWTKVNGKDVRFDQEKTGYGFGVDKKIEAAAIAQPTTCQMKRPARS